MDISTPIRIITVAYNPGDELQTFVDSLAEATSYPYELVICDNGQDSSVVDSVAQQCGAQVIRFGENLGYGKAINAGVAGYTGEWFVVANPDVSFEPGAIDTLVNETRFWPRGGAFGPRILTPDGKVYSSARRFPRLITGTGHAMLQNVWESNPFSRWYHGRNLPGHSRRTDWLSGACLLIRRKAFEEVGGFDKDYFMFFEDTQLGKDMREERWRSVYVPRALVIHDTSKSWRDHPASMMKAHHESAEKYFAKTHPKPWQAPMRHIVRLGLRLHSRFELTRKNPS
ncbi:MAG: glycosyltransferase family 2 protein [Actinomycetaceae bacterium]|nr:glycosyltransferase family 2 protein [Actinomycetaceae bacterium]